MCRVDGFKQWRRVVSAWGLVLVAFAAVMAAPALAQDAQEAAEELDIRGYYIEPDAPGDINDFEDLVGRADATGRNWYFVSLVAPAENGNDAFAQDIADALPVSGTVLIWSAFEDDEGFGWEVGAQSADYNSASIDDAIEPALDISPDAGPVEVLEEIFDNLSTEPIVAEGDTTSGSGGGFNPAWLLVPVGGVAVIGGGVFIANRRKEKAAAERDAADMETARGEIKAQLDVVADHVVTQSSHIDMSENAEAIAHYREATATFTEVDAELPKAESLLELAQLNDRIDHARWQMEAADALVDGRPVPPKPEPDKPVACFFDPTHKPGRNVCTVHTAAGDKEVNVCAECAGKLERGEQPQPRMIDVHGRRVPAAKAPRSHGGLGMGGIDVFDILLGGMGAGGRRPRRRRGGGFGGMGSSGGLGFDWTGGRRQQRPSRRPGGVFGPDRLPRSTPSRPRSTTSSGSSSTSRRSSGRSGGKRATTGRGRATSRRSSGRSRSSSRSRSSGRSSSRRRR